MKILLLEEEFPVLLNSGQRIRTWNFIESISKKHELDFLCFKDFIYPQFYEIIKNKCRNVWFVDRCSLKGKKEISFFNRFKNLIGGIPWDIAYSFSETYNKKLIEVFAKNQYDIAIARYLKSGQYLIKNCKKLKTRCIIDIDDVDSIKNQRFSDFKGYEGLYDRFRKALDSRFLDSYYRKLLTIDACVVCSNVDKEYVAKKKWSSNVYVVPNTVSLNRYKNAEKYTFSNFKNKIILFCGHLGYFPNVEGLNWFVKEVLPLISEDEGSVRLHIVGFRPKKEVKELVDNKRVFLFHDVPDVTPFYNNCSVAVVPIRMGGGTRIKIIEALACYRPVVSTTIGAEGLDITDGQHYLKADSSSHFAATVARLLRDFAAASKIAEQGYQRAKSYYDTSCLDPIMDSLLCLK